MRSFNNVDSSSILIQIEVYQAWRGGLDGESAKGVWAYLGPGWGRHAQNYVPCSLGVGGRLVQLLTHHSFA
jgi:hypothetical protein